MELSFLIKQGFMALAFIAGFPQHFHLFAKPL